MFAAILASLSRENRHHRRNRMVVLVLAGIVVVVAALYLYGRPQRVTLGHKEIDLTVLVYKLKAPSMKAWEDASIAGVKVGAFSYERLAIAVKGSTKIAINDPGKEGPIQVSVRMEDTDSGFGAAAIISHDGYLLTAAHCINVEPVSVVIKGKGRKLEEVRPRIVWKGKGSTEAEPDLALLHVDRVFSSTFTWGDDSGLSLRAPVFASGFSQFDEATCAGSVIRAPVARANDSGVKWVIFEHDAPITRGDSGGPVFGREGQLLGIIVQANTVAWLWRDKPVLWRQRAICHRPDMAWLKELMEKDRQTRRQQQAGKTAGTDKS